MFSKLAIVLEAACVVSAFPHMAEMVHQRGMEKRIAPIAPFPEYPGSPSHAAYNSFNATAQLIDVTGDHAWAAPTAGQIRGPCAGLNAAANHGYLPRSGIATADSIAQGLWEAFSLSVDATTFLETATRFFDGNPITGEWSIGYATDAVALPTGSTLGQITGICDYGHLKTEADASITRGDCELHLLNIAYRPCRTNLLLQSSPRPRTPTVPLTPISSRTSSISPMR